MKGIVFRIVLMLVFGLGGWAASVAFSSGGLAWILGSSLGGAVVGFLAAPYVLLRPYLSIKKRLEEAPAYLILLAVLGLGMALVLSALLALPLSELPGLWGRITPIVVAIVISYFFVLVMLLRGRDLLELFGMRLPGPTRAGRASSSQALLDTSAIIDGRIADITQTGFVRAELLIPGFVLDELQHIADSADPMRRKRGRRGLEMLNKLRKESDLPVRVIDEKVEDVEGVDGKLVKLGKRLRCPIISNDFNLNRVAELQGVKVLNVNELANAVKPVVLPGEEMAVQIIQEGREMGQGVAFLDDGTMVVVEGGKRYLNNRIDIVVTRVLQTAAGRMVFAHPKNGSDGRT